MAGIPPGEVGGGGAPWVGLAGLRLALHYGCNSALIKRLGGTFLSMRLIFIGRLFGLLMRRCTR